MSHHHLLATVEDQIRTLPLSLLSLAIAPKFWLNLDSPTSLQAEELLRIGRQALIVLYFDFMESRTLPLGAYDTIYQIVFAQRTYQLVLQHIKLPMGTVHSAPICAQVFYLWVAALRHSLEPSHFVAWFRMIFGSLIASVERAIKAQDFDLEDGTDADQRPAKKPRTGSEGKYTKAFELFYSLRALQSEDEASIEPLNKSPSVSKRPANNVDNTGTKPRTGRVRQAAATIMRKSSASSSSKFAPILDPMPPKMPKMPGAWPPTPQRPRHVVNDKSASFFRFRRTSYTNYRPPHFCPLN
ncbi:hypothetical protein B0H14DRAFT_2760524 [Mycena olivaceomarginata]|nr:hypothetical protein B0H14DRAFT_2760524 [Mycena olivaceomarginata]